MTIYQSSNKENFLQEIVQFITKNFIDDFSKLKIILPSGLLCSSLQEKLISKLGTSILPSIIPLGELIAESEEIFKIPSEQIGTITRLEEKITLAQIIHSYGKLNYDLSQSLRLAPSLANLFFEFEANNINLTDLKDIPVLDQPKHWHTIYDFLNYASTNWYLKIDSLQKMTRSSYQKLMFDSEIKRLRENTDENLVIAGLTGSSLITSNFIRAITELPNGYLILSPSANFNSETKFLPEDALFKIYKLLELLNNKKINLLGQPHYTILDRLITTSPSKTLKNDIKYIEFESIFHEAQYIANTCYTTLNNNPKNRIVIITHNQKAKEQYSIFLDKYQLKYHDSFGLDILKHNVISLIFLIAENLCCDFNTKTFFTFLSHPLINSPQAQELKNIIRKKNKFVTTLNDISDLINHPDNREIYDYFLKFYNEFTKKLKSKEFHNILKQVISSLETLIPNIWQQYPAIADSLSEITHINWYYSIENVNLFPELLKQALDGGRIINKTPRSNITISRPNDVALISYDLCIITDLNENNYPLPIHNSPWINSQMQNELNLNNQKANLGNSLYEFYLNLQNKNVLLTRAKKQGSNKQSLPSPFILYLKHILGNQLNSKIATPDGIEFTKPMTKDSAISKNFPQQISATDIETLIRAPYNFYTKKILKLQKTEEINDHPNLAEFGNFFHFVVENYSKTYQKTELDKQSRLKEIAESTLKMINLPDYSKKTWMTKLSALTDDFIKFDEERRASSANIYSEIKGSLELNVVGKKVTIIAIADRIEVDEKGVATILDYKTGAIPTKKDVLSGLSPQLLVEAIILSENGFKIETNKVTKLVYIKINSNTPYIKTIEISISLEDIYQHRQGLISLLEHYITNQTFAIEPNLMKYDDYAHISRRS